MYKAQWFDMALGKPTLDAGEFDSMESVIRWAIEDRGACTIRQQFRSEATIFPLIVIPHNSPENAIVVNQS